MLPISPRPITKGRIAAVLALCVALSIAVAQAVSPVALKKGNKTMPTQPSSIILAGGCFWGVQDLMRKLPGVLHTEVGYSGGIQPNPTYEDVKSGTTQHAEAVLIEYDAKVASLSAILDYFFKLHDPTTANRQGNDRGTQYRSVIFYADAGEKKEIEASILRASQSGRWKNPIVTQVEKRTPFFRAEEYHQDYLVKNPGGYTCHYIRD